MSLLKNVSTQKMSLKNVSSKMSILKKCLLINVYSKMSAQKCLLKNVYSKISIQKCLLKNDSTQKCLLKNVYSKMSPQKCVLKNVSTLPRGYCLLISNESFGISSFWINQLSTIPK